MDVATSAFQSILRDANGGASVEVTTRALAGRMPLRVGASLAGGTSERDAAAAELRVPNEDYRSLTLLAGTATRAGRPPPSPARCASSPPTRVPTVPICAN